jgi:MFS family permease
VLRPPLPDLEGDAMFVKDGRFLGKYDYAFVIMVCCCLIQAFAMGLILSCGSLFYVPVCDDLGFSRSEIATYMTGYFVGTTIATPIAGKLLAKYDIRKVMSAAIVALSSAVFAMSTYASIWQWQISGLVVGVAGSCIFVLPAASLVGNWFIRRRGMVYGVVMSCSGISTMIFSQVINGIIQSSGWRTAYAFVGIASLAVILPCCLIIRGRPSEIGAMPYGYAGPKDSLPVMRGVSVKTACASMAFWCLFLFAGIASFCHGGVEQHLPGYVESIGFSASFGALVVSAQSAGAAFDKLFMGWLNDRIGVQRTALLELLVVVVGLAGLIVCRDFWALAVSAILFGVQDSLASVSLPLLIREIFGSKDYTQIHAWIRTAVGIFGSLSGVLVGAAYDATGSFFIAFAGIVILLAVAAGCIIVAYRSRKHVVWDPVEA